jgi:hypothetical protein
MQKHRTAPSTFQFRRVNPDVIHVLNEGSYLMAEYSERSGVVKWQRVLIASQRENVERWLREHYPVRVTKPAKSSRGNAAARSKGV